MNYDLQNPSVSILIFALAGHNPQNESELFCNIVAQHDEFALTREIKTEGFLKYTGQRLDQKICQMTWTLAQDSHLIRLTLTQPGEHTPSSWDLLRTSIQDTADSLLENIEKDNRLAVTYLYQTTLKEDADIKELPEWFLEEVKEGDNGLTNSSAGYFGWLWILDDIDSDMQNSFGLSERRLVFLIPTSRISSIEKTLIAPLDQGIARIELYLQKGLYHWRSYLAVRAEFIKLRSDLESSIDLVLKALDLSLPYREQQEMEEIAHMMMALLKTKGHVQILRNSLENNVRNCNRHIDAIKLDSILYEQSIARLQNGMTQIDIDMRYIDATFDTVKTIREIQHDTEASRIGRSSFLLSGAAALLAAVTIFNSFLDIWDLAIGGTGLNLPNPAWRVFLGITVAINLPLAAYWWMEQRKKRALVASALVVLAILGAVIVMYGFL